MQKILAGFAKWTF